MTNPWKPAPPEPAGLLLKVRRGADGGFAAGARALTRGAEPLLRVDETDDGLGFGPQAPATWFRTDASENPWDKAHAMMRMGSAVGSGDLPAAEPDFKQQWVSGRPRTRASQSSRTAAAAARSGRARGWHLEAGFSGLADARSTVSVAD